MSGHVVVKIDERDEEFYLSADEFFTNESGELVIVKYRNDDPDDAMVVAQFSAYSYVHFEGDDETDVSSLEYLKRLAKVHGFVIDDPLDEDDEEDDEDEDDVEDDEADSAEVTVQLPDVAIGANGHGEAVDASPVTVLVPAEAPEPSPDDSVGPSFSASALS